MLPAIRCPVAVVSTASIVLMFHTAAPAQGPWAKFAPFPDPSEEISGVAANGKMYVFGGQATGLRPKGLVYEYAPGTDKWTQKKPMPLPAHHMATAEHRGKIYVFGGFVLPPDGKQAWLPLDNAWEYDPSADSWKALAPVPTKRGSPVAAEVGGKIYVIGGASVHPGSKVTVVAQTLPHRSVGANEAYDPATNRWETRSPMPTARNHAAIGAVNGKIYVIGGRLGAAFMGLSSNTDVVEEYDPATDQWGLARARMPTARSAMAYAVHNGRIYAAGGEVQNAQLAAAFRVVEAYEPATNRWFAMPPMTMPRQGLAAAFIGNRLHLVSGGVQAGGVQSALVSAGGTAGALNTSVHDALEIDGVEK